MPHFLRFASCDWLKALIKAFPLIRVFTRHLLHVGSLTSINSWQDGFSNHLGIMLLVLCLRSCVGHIAWTFLFLKSLFNCQSRSLLKNEEGKIDTQHNHRSFTFFRFWAKSGTNENSAWMTRNHETLNWKHMKELSVREVPEKNEHHSSGRGHAQGICTDFRQTQSYSVVNYLVTEEANNCLFKQINPLAPGNIPVYLLTYRHRSFPPRPPPAASPNQDCAAALWIAGPGNTAASGMGIQTWHFSTGQVIHWLWCVISRSTTSHRHFSMADWWVRG